MTPRDHTRQWLRRGRESIVTYTPLLAADSVRAFQRARQTKNKVKHGHRQKISECRAGLEQWASSLKDDHPNAGALNEISKSVHADTRRNKFTPSTGT